MTTLDEMLVKPALRPTANILLYGPPKSGKSAGGASAPGPLLLLNPDVGNSSRYAHLTYGSWQDGGKIKEPEIPRFQRGKTPVGDLLIKISHEISPPTQQVCQTLQIDPVGELHRRILEEESNYAMRPRRDDYGDVSITVERFCRHMCELPHVNTIIVCHELVMEMDDEENRLIPFTGTRGGSATLGQKLMGMVDIVGYCGVRPERNSEGNETGKIEYVAQLVPLKGRQGGDRFNCLGRVRKLDITEWLAQIESYESTLINTRPATRQFGPPPVVGGPILPESVTRPDEEQAYAEFDPEPDPEYAIGVGIGDEED